jgi:hypothetical protein
VGFLAHDPLSFALARSWLDGDGVNSFADFNRSAAGHVLPVRARTWRQAPRA